jgi:hypothetical protein
MKDNIYISSVAFEGKSVDYIIEVAKENEWAIEFSSGFPYVKDMEEIYLSAPLKKMVHNYFPAPAEPFVLNLASRNQELRQRSISHCINGLKLSRLSNSPFFAAHAGFCVDPLPSELGRKITYHSSFDKEEHWELFFDSVTQITKVASELNITFLIENNVIATFNMTDGKNPLLCCESEDITKLFTYVNSTYLGLLLDTAHLKVSCNTLSLSLTDEFEKIRPFVKALHHSDNDGTSDTNEELREDYWFLPLVREFANLVHVLEIKNMQIGQVKKQRNLLEGYGN